MSVDVPADLTGEAGDRLLHWDLRYDNILAGHREPWLAMLDLDRERAIGWTLGRVLQNALWDIEDGRTALEPAQVATVRALLA